MIHKFNATVLIAISVLVSSTITGCSSSNREERSWTEEVQLEDGSTVGIERHVVFDATNAMGGGAYNAVEVESTLRFRGELVALPEWNVPLIPLLLYKSVSGDKWTIVAKSSSCEVWASRGKPIPPYWQFELDESGWREVPLTCDSVGRSTNLHHAYHAADGLPHVSLARKARITGDPLIAQSYKIVLSSALVSKNYCMGGVRDGLQCEAVEGN